MSDKDMTDRVAETDETTSRDLAAAAAAAADVQAEEEPIGSAAPADADGATEPNAGVSAGVQAEENMIEVGGAEPALLSEVAEQLDAGSDIGASTGNTVRFSVETPAAGEDQHPGLQRLKSHASGAYAGLLGKQSDADGSAQEGEEATAKEPAAPDDADGSSATNAGVQAEDEMIEVDWQHITQTDASDAAATAKAPQIADSDSRARAEIDSGGWQLQPQTSRAVELVEGGEGNRIDTAVTLPQSDTTGEAAWASSLSHSSQRTGHRILGVLACRQT
eukprot:COSAG02_NODE_8156_length_2686_cov_6.780441_1_plen_277_part_00